MVKNRRAKDTFESSTNANVERKKWVSLHETRGRSFGVSSEYFILLWISSGLISNLGKKQSSFRFRGPVVAGLNSRILIRNFSPEPIDNPG